MAKTIRHVALSALLSATGAAFAMDDSLHLTGIDMSATSGTLELNRVSATTAVLSDDGKSVLADEMTFKAAGKGADALVARAPEGIIIIAGPRPPKLDAASALPTFDQSTQYADNFLTAAFVGDLLLRGKGKDSQATAQMGTQAALVSEMIVWSERFRCIVLPRAFEQNGKVPGGGEMSISGAGLVVNREFTEWQYFTDADKPLTMNYSKPADPAAPKKGAATP